MLPACDWLKGKDGEDGIIGENGIAGITGPGGPDGEDGAGMVLRTQTEVIEAYSIYKDAPTLWHNILTASGTLTWEVEFIMSLGGEGFNDFIGLRGKHGFIKLMQTGRSKEILGRGYEDGETKTLTFEAIDIVRVETRDTAADIIISNFIDIK